MNKKSSNKTRLLASKRLISEVKWASLEKKKAEKKSSVKEVSTVGPTKSLSVTFKLSWEVVAMELMKVYELVMEELSTEAGG